MDPILQLAINKARELPYRRHHSRHYAILTDKRGMIIAEGSNSYTKTHPLFKHTAESIGVDGKSFQHAEFVTINKDRSGRGHRLYVARVDSKGNPVMSMPCAVCTELIRRNKNIKSINWT